MDHVFMWHQVGQIW